MLARIGSRHFAHLYMSGLLPLRLGLRGRLGDLALERGRHDGPIRAAREDITTPVALPDGGRFPMDRDREAPRTGVLLFQALLDFLDPAADSHPIAGAETGDDACLSRATGHGGPQED